MSDKYVININVPIEKKDLISELKTLKKPTVNTPRVEHEEVSDQPFMLSSLGGKKKDKKKKKGKLDSQFMAAGELTTSRDEDDNSDDYEVSSLIDIDELLRERDEEDDIDDGIIGEQKNNYDKLKKEDNPYKKEFAEELTLLYNLMDEMNKFGKELEKKYKGLESSKVRGISKYINELITSIITCKQGKLQILKEISSVKKSIVDLKIKAEGKKEAAQGANSPEYLASAYLKNVLKFGRNNFVKKVSDYGTGDYDEDDDNETDRIVARMHGGGGFSHTDGYIPEDVDRYMNFIEDKLDRVDNPFRSAEGNKYIEYENRGVKIYIKKCIDTGEWEFVALDKDNQQILGYPVPTKRDAGKIKFGDDGRYATDQMGRSYKVIEYYS